MIDFSFGIVNGLLLFVITPTPYTKYSPTGTVKGVLYLIIHTPPKKNHLNPELKGHLPQIGLGMSDVGLDAALLGLGFKGILYYVI